VSRGKVRLERTLHAPIAAVFGLLTDLERTPEWDPRVTRVTQMTRGPLRVGVILRSSLAEEGKEVHFDDEVTDFEPPTRFGLRSVLGGTNALSYELADEGARLTSLAVTVAYDLPDAPPEAGFGDERVRETIRAAMDRALDLLGEAIDRDAGDR
jgi:uncharacterized protein YndB with AHSA1/START domain